MSIRQHRTSPQETHPCRVTDSQSVESPQFVVCSRFCAAPCPLSVKLRGDQWDVLSITVADWDTHDRRCVTRCRAELQGQSSTVLVTAEAKAEEQLAEAYNHSFRKLRSHYAVTQLEDSGMWSHYGSTRLTSIVRPGQLPRHVQSACTVGCPACTSNRMFPVC